MADGDYRKRDDLAFRITVERISALMEHVDYALSELRPEVDRIIDNNIQSQTVIEHTLDILLDFCSCGKGEEEFMRLHAHYSRINPDYASEYMNIYREHYEE